MMRPPQVSFSRGNVLTLHNLELDLAPLLGGAAALAHVRRAFARRLSITIPWTALTTQPIQVGRPSPCAGLQRLAAWQGIAAGNYRAAAARPGGVRTSMGCGQAWGAPRLAQHPAGKCVSNPPGSMADVNKLLHHPAGRPAATPNRWCSTL